MGPVGRQIFKRRLASGLAFPTGLCANSAVFMHPGMAFTLRGAAFARQSAGLELGEDQGHVAAGPTRGQPSGGQTNVFAIHVQANALDKFSHTGLAETGVRAGAADLGALQAGLDTSRQNRIHLPADMRMDRDHLFDAHELAPG